MKVGQHKKILSLLAIGVGILGIMFYRNMSNKPQTQIVSEKAEKGTIVSSLSVSGQIISANVINITSGAKGLVKNVWVKDGDTVTAGQNILEMTLDTDGLQRASLAYASYLSAKNSLDSARAGLFSSQSDMLGKWKTYMELAQSSSYQNSDLTPKDDARNLPQFKMAQDDWFAAEAKYKIQQNAIIQSQMSLNNSWNNYQAVAPIINAPMGGIISNITYVPGMTINATTDSPLRVAVIESEGSPMGTFNISEIDISKVAIEQKATITLDNFADKTYTGKILSVDRMGTVNSGVTSYPIIIKLDSDAREILPNMSATANIILNVKDNVLLVSSSAIQKQNNQNVVRVIKNGQTQTVEVEVGLSSETQTEIISGLNEGDEVITSSVVSSQTPQGRSGGSVFGGVGGLGGGANRGFGGR